MKKKIGVFILISCLLLTLCACESEEERWARETKERTAEINKSVERNEQQSKQLSKDMAEFARLINGQ